VKRLTILLAPALAIALLAAPAGALAVEHPFKETFGSSAQPSVPAEGQFSGLAVDQSSGDILAIDRYFASEKQSITFVGVANEDEYVIRNLPSLCSSSETAHVKYFTSGSPRKNELLAKLEGKCGAGTFASSIGAPTPVNFQGELANVNWAELECEMVTGVGSCSISNVQEGHTPALYRYHADGTAAPFGGLGVNAIDGKRGPGSKSCGEESSSCDQTPQNGVLGATTNPEYASKEVQVAIDNSGTATDGDIYLTNATKHVINIFAPEGAYLGQLTESSEGPLSEPCGVAVDSAGAVYVGDYAGHIHKYANPPVDGASTDFAATHPCGVAAGAGPTAGSLFYDPYEGASGLIRINASSGAEECALGSGGYRTLTVDPSSGHLYGGNASAFNEWSGECPESEVSSTTLASEAEGLAVNGSTGNVYVTRVGDSHVEVYEPLASGPEGPPLTLNIEEGTGTVVSNPAGLECTGEAPHSCETEEIEEGTVTLTASPAPGYRFKSWKKCDPKSGEFGVNGRQCTIDLSEAKEVGAKFVPTFDVTLDNNGGGKVYSKPGGAVCLPNCTTVTASFDEGKTVEVLTKPNKHFHFTEWGGDCSGSGACSASSEAEVEASFAEDAKFALSLEKEGGGTGLVKTKPGGLNCSYTCFSQSVDFYEGENPEVIWKLGKGTSSVQFSGEAGDCPASSEALEGSCHIEMDEAHSFVATFE
jgi:hypothetical protein